MKQEAILFKVTNEEHKELKKDIKAWRKEHGIDFVLDTEGMKVDSPFNTSLTDVDSSHWYLHHVDGTFFSKNIKQEGILDIDPKWELSKINDVVFAHLSKN